MENQRDQELIQRYIDHDAGPEEIKEVEYRLSQEPEFKKMHREFSNLPAGIRYHFLTDKLEQLRTLEKALPVVEGEARVVSLLSYWKPLAAAAVLIISATVIFLNIGSESTEELYARNFEPYPNVFEPTQRSADNLADKRATAFAYYEQGEYAKAAALFNELLSEKKEPEILLLLGNANMVLNRDEDAKNNFLMLIRDFDGLDEQAKWFLSLCYLKSGEREKARLIWEELGDPKVTYSEKAKRLLKEAGK
jgi:tetratricopeptide (TPR) repeat protein